MKKRASYLGELQRRQKSVHSFRVFFFFFLFATARFASHISRLNWILKIAVCICFSQTPREWVSLSETERCCCTFGNYPLIGGEILAAELLKGWYNWAVSRFLCGLVFFFQTPYCNKCLCNVNVVRHLYYFSPLVAAVFFLKIPHLVCQLSFSAELILYSCGKTSHQRGRGWPSKPFGAFLCLLLFLLTAIRGPGCAPSEIKLKKAYEVKRC